MGIKDIRKGDGSGTQVWKDFERIIGGPSMFFIRSLVNGIQLHNTVIHTWGCHVRRRCGAECHVANFLRGWLEKDRWAIKRSADLEESRKG